MLVVTINLLTKKREYIYSKKEILTHLKTIGAFLDQTINNKDFYGTKYKHKTFLFILHRLKTFFFNPL